MRKDSIKAGLRAGALSAFALLVGAQASVAAVVLEGDDVITYEHTVTLAGASRSIIEGERLPDGGCRFSQSRTLDREATVTELELAFEPATCRSLIESGKRVSGDVLPEAGAQSQARTGERVCRRGRRGGLDRSRDPVVVHTPSPRLAAQLLRGPAQLQCDGRDQ